MKPVAAVPSPLPKIEGAITRVQLLPVGKLTPVDRRGPWYAGDPAAIIAASMPQVERGMPVDLDHAIDRKQPAPAAGWIKALTHDQKCIWADIEWTPMGKARIEAREYRFISPTLIIDKGNNVLRIDRAGLTNVPALEMAAICAKDDAVPTDNPQSGVWAAADLQQLLTSLRSLLGLPDTASVTSILSTVREFSTVKAEAVPVVEQLASAMFDGWSARRADEVEQRVTAAMQQGRLPPRLEAWARKVCASNTDLFDEFLKSAPDLAYLTQGGLAGRAWQGEARATAPNSVFAQLGVEPS